MTRWSLALLGTLLVAGALAVAAARLLGRSGARGSQLVSVAALWLGAWVLWNFAGGLLLHWGALQVWDGHLLAILALPGGLWHYRTLLRRGREAGLILFAAAQLGWLGFVLLRNGLLG